MGQITNGIYVPDIDLTNLNKMKEVKYMADRKGVEETYQMLELIGNAYDAIYEARAGDGKIDFPEDYIAISFKVGGKILPAFNGASEIVDEIIFDELSDADKARLGEALDEAKHLKGDTRDAARELTSILADLNNWRLKHFGEPEAPQV